MKNGIVRQTRYKLTTWITRAVLLFTLLSIVGDVVNIFMFKKEFSPSELTMILIGALIARWGSSWDTYFKAKDIEDIASNSGNVNSEDE